MITMELETFVTLTTSLNTAKTLLKCLLPTFRTALVVFTNIGHHRTACKAGQGGGASADVPR